MRKNLLITATLATAMAVGGIGVGYAAAGGGGGAVGQDGRAAASPAGPSPAATITCNALAHKAMRATLNNAPTTFAEAAASATLATQTINVPGTANARLRVEFTAETQLRGGPEEFDWIQLDLYMDGTLLNPNDATSPYAIKGDASYSGNVARACVIAAPGVHTITAKYKIVDNGTDQVLTGWIDDWMLTTDRYLS